MLALLMAKLLYLVEKLTGDLHYRNPHGWYSDMTIPYGVVLFWEEKIFQLFNTKCYHHTKDGAPGTDPLRWLALLAEDDNNNREEYPPEVTEELYQRGFLNRDNKIVSVEVAVVIRDVVKLSYRGARLHLRLYKPKI